MDSSAGYIFKTIESGINATQTGTMPFLAENVVKSFNDKVKSYGGTIFDTAVSTFGNVEQGIRSVMDMHSPSVVMENLAVMASDSFTDKLIDRSSEGLRRWSKEIAQLGGEEFLKMVETIAKRLHVDPAALMNVMAAESRFNPRVKNPLPGQSASGLFQATNESARQLGYKNANELRLSPVAEQLEAMGRYLKQRGVRAGDGVTDIYGAVGYGSALHDPSRTLFSRGSKRYTMNAPAWDMNHDGRIQYGELGQFAQSRGGFRSVGGTARGETPAAPLYVTFGGASAEVNAAVARLAQGSARPRDLVGGASSLVFGQQTSNGDLVNGGSVNGGSITAGLDPIDDRNLISGISTSLVQTSSMPTLPVKDEKAIATTEKATGKLSDLMGKQNHELLTKLGSMSTQASSLIPSQQVGGKRSLFSKILGVAAPFLNFIPGAGPILSQFASIASSAIGGDYAGAITGAAGLHGLGGGTRGLSPEALTSRLQSMAATGGTEGISTSLVSTKLVPRARGGRFTRGRSYLVGEERPEVVQFDGEGYVHPSIDHFSRSAGASSGESGLGARLMALIEKVHAQTERHTEAIERLNSFPADHVVMKGAAGLNRAMDRNAGLSEQYGRRLGLAR